MKGCEKGERRFFLALHLGEEVTKAVLLGVTDDDPRHANMCSYSIVVPSSSKCLCAQRASTQRNINSGKRREQFSSTDSHHTSIIQYYN